MAGFIDAVARLVGRNSLGDLEEVNVQGNKLVTSGMIEIEVYETPLTSGNFYTSSVFDLQGYTSIAFAVFTDKAGTAAIQFSVDGTNWDSTINVSISASVPDQHRYAVLRRYMRYTITNTAATDQTIIRASILAGSFTTPTSNLNSQIQSDADTIITRPMDFNLMVAEGLYQNRVPNLKDAFNTGIANTVSVTSPADISNEISGAGAYAGFPATPEEGQIVVAGADTGTVYYSYLASSSSTDYVFGSKAVAGAGNYDLGHNIWRCNFAYFVGSGGAVNVGNITVRHKVTTANVFCRIDANFGQSFCGAYTVPAGQSAYIDRMTSTLRGNSSGQADGYFWWRPNGESPRLRLPFEAQAGALYFDDIDYLVRVPALVDIIPRITYASNNGTNVKVSYRILRVTS